MGFWIFMYICTLFVPAVMIFAGRMMWKNCPKEINSLIGYRTSRSMKNMDTWKFAHEYAGKLWWKFGWILLAISTVILPFFIGGGEDTIGVVGGAVVMLQTAVLVISIFPTEKALKKNFDENGNRI